MTTEAQNPVPGPSLKDLQTDNPRWCTACGDFGVLMGVKRFMVDKQMSQVTTVNVSGIGCSGRTTTRLEPREEQPRKMIGDLNW